MSDAVTASTNAGSTPDKALAGGIVTNGSSPQSGLSDDRGRRSRLVGRIIRIGTTFTTFVQVNYSHPHAKYRKHRMFTRKFAVHHDNSMPFAIGDTVEIVACRPISKTKHFRLNKVLMEAGVAPVTKIQDNPLAQA